MKINPTQSLYFQNTEFKTEAEAETEIIRNQKYHSLALQPHFASDRHLILILILSPHFASDRHLKFNNYAPLIGI